MTGVQDYVVQAIAIRFAYACGVRCERAERDRKRNYERMCDDEHHDCGCSNELNVVETQMQYDCWWTFFGMYYKTRLLTF